MHGDGTTDSSDDLKQKEKEPSGEPIHSIVPTVEDEPPLGNEGVKTKEDDMAMDVSETTVINDNLQTISNDVKEGDTAGDMEVEEEVNGKTAEAKVNGSDAPPPSASIEPSRSITAIAPPPPVMKGTLSVDLNSQRRHLIRGMWNYENSTTFPPQRFELLRNLGPEEDVNVLPIDGEFHGSFSLAYFHTTSKGKQKERSKVISETGVMIQFIPITDGSEPLGSYRMEGKGTNQFGIFHIYGVASPTPDAEDNTMNIVFRKRYEPNPNAALVVATDANNTPGNNIAATSVASDPLKASVDALPDPAKSFPSGVVALRGQLYKEESNDLGSTEVIHRINGTWASGLDYIEADPQNLRGFCNRFEYEHKSAVPTHQFPVSGKYSGWFDLSNEDGTRTRINERDVTLKFRTNNQGYQNVEGKGSNVFGKYTITGTLTKDNVITIFRHFQPRKLKKATSALPLTEAPEPSPVLTSNAAASSNISLQRRSILSSGGPVDPKLSLDDVVVPVGSDDKEPFDPIVPPVAGTYSAVSRGVLRVNDDGSHGCQGKWATTREHFTNGQTSSFTFRLEPHFVTQEAAGGNENFPLDSAMYKGSFQLKKQGSRYQTIVDQQIVMKFRRNKHGAFNVHGTGINVIGEFNLLGTLVTSGKTGGQVELYRMYPPEKLNAQAVAPPSAPKPDMAVGSAPRVAPPVLGTALSGAQHQLQRRESSRMIKLPSRLEEDDPDAQLLRTMDKCAQILKFMRERDVELGAFFSEPVDPVALGIPTYLHVVKEPMDLRTIDRKMEAGEIESPEEFARLVRLVFENAMTFNIDPGHSVHQAARNLLVSFNQKFRDVERMVQSIRRAHGIDVDDTGRPRGKDDKKRKRDDKSLKRIRLEEAQQMTTANSTAVAAIMAAMPTTNVSAVSRNEFNLLLQLVVQLQQQIVQTHTALAELSPGDEDGVDTPGRNGNDPAKASALLEKKKALKRKAESEDSQSAPSLLEDSAQLTLKEQELLMETINGMPQEHLSGVLQIIREAAPLDENDDVIDMGIDQLDDKTQRKLFRHVQAVSGWSSFCLSCFMMDRSSRMTLILY
jgi:Bromodomain/Bromodomain extra-terminal - transcription regulation